jgi:hypothetical protein
MDKGEMLLHSLFVILMLREITFLEVHRDQSMYGRRDSANITMVFTKVGLYQL